MDGRGGLPPLRLPPAAEFAVFCDFAAATRARFFLLDALPLGGGGPLGWRFGGASPDRAWGASFRGGFDVFEVVFLRVSAGDAAVGAGAFRFGFLGFWLGPSERLKSAEGFDFAACAGLSDGGRTGVLRCGLPGPDGLLGLPPLSKGGESSSFRTAPGSNVPLASTD